jgi:transcriptional regulator with XRE-family HTH domain
MAKNGTPRAPQLLREWLARNQRSQAWLARSVGVSPQQLGQYLEKGAEPGLKIALAIESLTQIPVDAWLPLERKSKRAP